MKQCMKNLAAGLLAFALMVMLLPAGSMVSFAASGKLSFSDRRFGGRSGICHDEDHFGRSSRFLGRDAPV